MGCSQGISLLLKLGISMIHEVWSPFTKTFRHRTNTGEAGPEKRVLFAIRTVPLTTLLD
jgi:hypothetical protein